MDRKAKGAMNTTTTTDPMDAMTTIGIRQATDEWYITATDERDASTADENIVMTIFANWNPIACVKRGRQICNGDIDTSTGRHSQIMLGTQILKEI